MNWSKSKGVKYRSVNWGIWINLPYWAWKTVLSVTGNPSPIRGENINSASFSAKSPGSKSFGSLPLANGKSTTFPLASII